MLLKGWNRVLPHVTALSEPDVPAHPGTHPVYLWLPCEAISRDALHLIRDCRSATLPYGTAGILGLVY